ncbi:DUF935 domain-containing protein [Castellaniella hirudinis]|uniref:DUF935 domain-containing protein n=1 Tax=Castellaniella hirudinis TaxID=1144617 RepID=UPI0039C0838E
MAFAEARAPRKPVKGQIASRSRIGGFGGIEGLLPNPDPVLRAAGKSIEVYRTLRADPHVGGCVRRRKSAVRALERGVRKGDAADRVVADVEAMLADLDLERIIGEILDAPLYGYQPLEVDWQMVGRHWVVADVVGKPSEWFAFDSVNGLRFLAKDAGREGLLVPWRKFLLPRQDASYDNPYGQPDLARCFWPIKFKQGGLDFWNRFVEKYGSPWLIGKTPRSASTQESEELLEKLDAMVSDAVGVVPDDSSVEIIEAAGKTGSADVYDKFLRRLSGEVSIALLGQDQTTEADANRASAQAGIEVAEDIRDADAGLVSATLTQLIRWYVEVNFGGPAPVYELWDQAAIDQRQAERDKGLGGLANGPRFTRLYWERAYGYQEGDLSDAPVGGAMPGLPALGFAESPVVADTPIHQANQVSDVLGGAVDGWIDAVRALADRVDSLEALRDGLMDLFPGMSLDDYAQRMAQALAAAALAGRYEIVEEAARGS